MVKKIFSKLFGVSKPEENQEHEAATPSKQQEEAPKPQPKADAPPKEAPAEATVGDVNLNLFVEYVVKALVMKPDEVQVTSEVDEQGLLIRIRCHQDEIGRVIGKSGKTIRAIRSLVKGAAARQNQKASVIVMED